MIPDDIKLLAPLTLTHRIILKPEGQLRGRTARTVMQDILSATKVPLED